VIFRLDENWRSISFTFIKLGKCVEPYSIIIHAVLEMCRYVPVDHNGTSFCSLIKYRHFSIYVWLQTGRPGDPGSIPGRGNRFSSNLCVQTGTGAHLSSCTMGTGGSFPVVKGDRGVTLTTHPHLVSRSRMSRSYTSSPLCASIGMLWDYLFLLINMYYIHLYFPIFFWRFILVSLLRSMMALTKYHFEHCVRVCVCVCVCVYLLIYIYIYSI
jgi:hypothetical protein